MVTVTCAAAQAAPVDARYRAADARAVSAKRQVIDCMNKSMAANRTLSYNEATRLCRSQINQVAAQSPVVAASGAPFKAASAP
jgi:hypothetical protein